MLFMLMLQWLSPVAHASVNVDAYIHMCGNHLGSFPIPNEQKVLIKLTLPCFFHTPESSSRMLFVVEYESQAAHVSLSMS